MAVLAVATLAVSTASPALAWRGGWGPGLAAGIIGGAIPSLDATSKLAPSQLSIVVAAVLLGSVFSTLFAGMLADWMGRKPLMRPSYSR